MGTKMGTVNWGDSELDNEPATFALPTLPTLGWTHL